MRPLAVLAVPWRSCREEGRAPGPRQDEGGAGRELHRGKLGSNWKQNVFHNLLLALTHIVEENTASRKQSRWDCYRYVTYPRSQGSAGSKAQGHSTKYMYWKVPSVSLWRCRWGDRLCSHLSVLYNVEQLPQPLRVRPCTHHVKGSTAKEAAEKMVVSHTWLGAPYLVSMLLENTWAAHIKK